MKRFLLLVLIITMPFFAPDNARAWNEELGIRIMLDATKMAPNRVRSLFRGNKQTLGPMLYNALSEPVAGRNPAHAYDQAVADMKDATANPEKALRSFVELARFYFAATQPTADTNVLDQLAKADSLQQVEFDGIQYIADHKERIEISRRATENARKNVTAWLADRGTDLAAAEGVALSYHVTVNNMADLMATVWKEASSDTANTASKRKRIWHGKGKGAVLSLPKGFDPVPYLKEYYRDINSAFADNRIEHVGEKPPVPKGLYLFNIKGLKIITKTGHEQREEWKEAHTEPTPTPAPESASAPKQQPDIRQQPRPDMPSLPLAPIPGQAVPMSHSVHHRPMESENKGPQGTLDEASIEETIGRKLPQLRACYQRVQRTTNASGNIVASFIIATDGSVNQVDIVDDTMHSEEMNQCVVQALRTAHFPKPEGDAVTIRYPFIFQ